MNGRMKKIASKLIAGFVTTAMSLALIPNVLGDNTVQAATTKDQSNTCLGTSQIAPPATPSVDSTWSGSYVYFGSYGSNAIKFRVLAPSTSAYGGSTLFLDSDETLFKDYFDNTSPYSNSWADSDIRATLNGSFLSGFTILEKAAIATSTGNGGLTYDSFGTYYFGSPVSVNDQVFLLDVSEVMNPAYGYSSDSGYTDDDDDWSNGYASWHAVPNRVKGGSSAYWWLRSANKDYSNIAVEVSSGGNLDYRYYVNYSTDGVAPALNINQSSIFFSSLISGSFNTVGAEYKLTLFDKDLSVTVPAGEQPVVTGNKVSIPYTVSGVHNRVSVLILDKEYADENANGASILYYDAFDDAGSFDFSSTGLDIVDWGTSYYVYVVAESVNGTYETDYASRPVKVDAPEFTVVFEDEDGTVLSSSDYVYGTAADDVIKPADPTKASDAQYTYTFAGWTPAIADVTADATYKATYSKTVNKYEIKFVNEDGTVLQNSSVAYGSTPSYTGATPEKAADAQYTYTFSGWTPAISAVTGNATYTATYSNTVNQYTVKFVDEDGAVLSTKAYDYGTAASAIEKPADPVKAADAQYTYTFAGWTPEIKNVEADATYTATYNKTVNKYIVRFFDEDGTLLSTKEYPYGTLAADIEKPADPTKAADAQYTYTFAGWTPEIKDVKGNATYKATYTSTVNEYTVKFVDEDGTVLSTNAYPYGTLAADIIKPADPTKAADAQYTYTFAGWTPEIADVTGDATYKAAFTKTVNQYTVKFVNEDGTEISSKKYDYGTLAADIVKPADPTKAADAQYTYTFTGWTPEIADVTGDATYKAQYSKTVNEYTVKFAITDDDVLQIDKLPYGAIPVYVGETPVLAETEDERYEFEGWAAGTDFPEIYTGTLPAVTGDVTYYASFKVLFKIKYTVGEVKNDGNDIVADIHRNIDDENCISYFRSVKVDGKAIAVGSQYTATAGSTIIRLKAEYLNTLKAGEHTVTVTFTDGEVSFKIKVPEKEASNLPSTGELIAATAFIGSALVLLAGAATAVLVIRKRRKETL